MNTLFQSEYTLGVGVQCDESTTCKIQSTRMMTIWNHTPYVYLYSSGTTAIAVCPSSPCVVLDPTNIDPLSSQRFQPQCFEYRGLERGFLSVYAITTIMKSIFHIKHVHTQNSTNTIQLTSAGSKFPCHLIIMYIKPIITHIYIYIFRICMCARACV